MSAVAPVGIHNYLAPREAAVADGPADNKAPGGIKKFFLLD